MSKDTANAQDEVEITQDTPDETPERKVYKVVSENGLFKNGKQYDAGAEIELDDKTAANFIAAGDIEEL